MINLQEKILNQYKNQFPNDTLKSISNRTGIQQTRVFRLINGSEMKISEYQQFQNILNLNNSSPLNNLYYECEKRFSQAQKDKVYKYLSYQLKKSKLINELVITHPLQSVLRG